MRIIFSIVLLTYLLVPIGVKSSAALKTGSTGQSSQFRKVSRIRPSTKDTFKVETQKGKYQVGILVDKEGFVLSVYNENGVLAGRDNSECPEDEFTCAAVVEFEVSKSTTYSIIVENKTTSTELYTIELIKQN